MTRCRNCGKIITMSNITAFTWGMGDICKDCMNANQGVNMLLMKQKLDQEEGQIRREKFEIERRETRKAYDNRMNAKYEIQKQQREMREAIEIESDMEAKRLKREAYLNSPQYKIDQEKEKDKQFIREIVRMQKEQRIYATKQIRLNLIDEGRINVYDEIELDKTMEKFRVIKKQIDLNP